MKSGPGRHLAGSPITLTIQTEVIVKTAVTHDMQEKKPRLGQGDLGKMEPTSDFLQSNCSVSYYVTQSRWVVSRSCPVLSHDLGRIGTCVPYPLILLSSNIRITDQFHLVRVFQNRSEPFPVPSPNKGNGFGPEDGLWTGAASSLSV